MDPKLWENVGLYHKSGTCWKWKIKEQTVEIQVFYNIILQCFDF